MPEYVSRAVNGEERRINGQSEMKKPTCVYSPYPLRIDSLFLFYDCRKENRLVVYHRNEPFVYDRTYMQAESYGALA